MPKQILSAILLGDDMWLKNAVGDIKRLYSQISLDIEFLPPSRIIIDENDAPISSIYLSKETF